MPSLKTAINEHHLLLTCGLIRINPRKSLFIMLTRINAQKWLNLNECCEPQPSNHPHPTIDLPTLPDSIFPTRPVFLQKVVAKAHTREERDILLLGSLVPLGACLPNFYSIYDDMKVYPYLYLFITAQASAGKGKLVHCKQLVMPIHLEMRQQTKVLKEQYDLDIQKYKKQKSMDFTMTKPIKPPERMLIIPANSSATGMFQLLSENDGCGLLFETEGDTLAQTFKSDYGNYSDGFRKGSHHEAITYYRKTDRELVEILLTRIAALLSGTPKQIASLIHDAENGLFSQFLFYYMNINTQWKDVLANSNDKNGAKEYFDSLGQEFLQLYHDLNKNPEIQFCVTDEQHDQFNAFFISLQDKYLALFGMDYLATIRRFGLIVIRIAMIFTALRIMETGNLSEKQMCSDTDFQAALSMVKILVKHSGHVFSELPQEVKPAKLKNRKEQFLDKLPEKFNSHVFLELAISLSIAERTAFKYISTFCENGLILREQKDYY